MIRKESCYHHAMRVKPEAWLFLFLFSFFLLTACAAGREESPGASIGEVAQKPSDYIGEQVTVRGEVEESYGNRAFTIDETQTFGQELFVIADPSVNLTEGLKGDFVEVTGTVRRFNRTQIEQDLGIQLDSEVVNEIPQGEPVIVATEVTRDTEEFDGLGGGVDGFDEPGLEEDDEFFEPGLGEDEILEPGIDEPGL